ncbi:hypothetical protein A2230_08745 [candidate division WOR-1 bacterium RIFOXYA2_FULL_36_21]|uniref:glycogen phosphorylase n=1 Tax=candidate division WOR-1 bacterium RIFOXYB2_FULL_36_35 TaxID=1802578 RepID=A0A1F4RYN8_UNCSA|nr:MAG: hypothetical protein A2230_08745 [candidate division WOR-1 bacterium RIFOXYA2_FULL_36_21]OGC13298.1 MAG: hypothetical protein A2290_08190 [candidate division WOR-1 bacterium RIFOXYB2_FULL_36_35]
MKEKFLKLSFMDINDPRTEKDVSNKKFFDFPIESIINAEENLYSEQSKSVAYFSMEFGLSPSFYNTFKSFSAINEINTIKSHEIFSNLKDMDYYHRFEFEELLDLPIYSGGLGVLAGDTLKSCADLNLSVAGIGILWGKGYFKQNFWFKYGQFPEELRWDPKTYPGLIPLDKYVYIELDKFKVKLKLWKYYIYSFDKKHVVPLILMDSDIEENPEEIRNLTDQLYRSDNQNIKIAQRTILGIGGAKALNELGYKIDTHHLNEGHAALAFVELIKKYSSAEEAKNHLAYTCHTPVEAGHDRFQRENLKKFLDKESLQIIEKTKAVEKDLINLTKLAMDTTSFVNAVAQKHGEITRLQFPMFKEKIKSITNGVHVHTWVSESIAKLLDKYRKTIGDWRQEPQNLKHISSLGGSQHFKYDLWNAHKENKKNLCKTFKHWLLEEHIFTICWARRIAPYKRPSLILHNLTKLIDIAKTVGPLQIILAGKAHPSDNMGSSHIKEIMDKIDQLSANRDAIKIIFLENYDTYIAKLLTSSVDLWLNNPLPPFEASGTSGMKAILNGIPQLTTLDGWVVEAKDWGIGRIFGYTPPPGTIGSEQDKHLDDDSEALYKNLEELMALYYRTLYEKDFFYQSEWLQMMINCIAAAGYFNTQRMVIEYNQSAWKQPLAS